MKKLGKSVLAVTLALVMVVSLTVTGLTAVSAANTINAPTNVRIQNSANGLYVTWNKATNAAKYRVFYKTKESDWSYKDSGTNNINLNNLLYGTLYYIQIQSLGNNNARGNYTKVTSMTHVRTTKLTSAVYNSNGSVTVRWNLADGANGYAVAKKKQTDKTYTYYYTADTSFTDKAVEAGDVYYYQIRPYYTNGKSAAYAMWSNSLSVTTLFRPTITNVNSTVENININWNRINGAKSYQLAYKRATDNSWYYRTTSSNYFNVSNPTQGATYYIQVRPINGIFTGPWSEVATCEVEPLGVPTMTSMEPTYDKVTFKWSGADGATSYDVAFRRENVDPEGTWHHKTATDTTLTVDKPTPGATYTVKVRAVRGNNYGEYSDTIEGVIPVLGTPVITNVNATIYQMTIDWDNVDDATGYQVAFKRSTDKAWNFRTTTSPTYTVPNPTKGATYYIQVRALYNNLKGSYTHYYTQVIPEMDPYEGLTYYEAGETVKVTHPAETELVWVVDEAAHDETKTEVKSVYHYRICQCPDCGAVMDGWTAEQIREHDLVLHGIGIYWNGQTFLSYPDHLPYSKPKSGYVDEPVDTILHVSEKGHYEVKVIKEAWEEEVTIAQSGWYKTVTHPAETAQAKVIDKAACYYEEPVYEYVYKHLCWGCDADVGVMDDKETLDHATMHHNKGEISGYRKVKLQIKTGTNTINVPETSHTETVITKQTYNELVFVLNK